MEKSNKKLANTILYYVIGLCLLVILAVTLITGSAKKERSPVSTTETNTEIISSETETDTVNNVFEIYEAESVTNNDVVVSVTEDEENTLETQQTVTPQAETFSAPINGYISKEYTVDAPVYSVTMNDYRAHTGIDFVCEEGSAVASCASGTVKNINNHPLMGTSVTIEHHNGVRSHYMNLNETLPPDITVGATVTKGQLIGAVGNTAIVEIAQEPHLHFEMTVDGVYVDPVSVLDMSTVTVMSDSVIE